MTDSERREALLILINRAMRGVLLADELVLLRRLVDAEVAAGDEACADAERYKQDHLRTCELVAAMHAAAVGEVRGPIRGVVEDVADVRTRAEQAEAAIARVRGLTGRWAKRTDQLKRAAELLEAALDGPQCCGGGPRGNCPCMYPADAALAQQRAAGYAAQADAIARTEHAELNRHHMRPTGDDTQEN